MRSPATTLPPPAPFRPPAWLALVWLGVAAGVIYGVDCGRGFIKDDYSWIATSHLGGWADVRRLFVETPMGFYRPLVSISFGLNERLSGLQPLPYGLTNLAMTLAVAGMIAALARRLGLAAGVAVFAAGVWLFNFHGINMAILWISGRTSLLATLAAVVAAWAFAGSRFKMAGVFVAAALFSKEEPILLPLVFALWTAIDIRVDDPGSGLAWRMIPWRTIARRTWPSWIGAAVYLALRANTSALTPATAPDFYRLSAAAIGANSLQYLDRSLTFTLALLALGALAMDRQRFAMTGRERAIAVKGAVWLVLGFALTLMVPVRSSLYACFPSVGSALIAAAIGSAEWRAMRWRPAVVTLLLLLPVALAPVYSARNSRLREEARLGAETLALIEQSLTTAQVERVIVYDDRGQRPSIADAFGDVLPAAVRLFVPAAAATEVIVVPAVDAGADVADAGTVKLVMRGGHLVAASPR